MIGELRFALEQNHTLIGRELGCNGEASDTSADHAKVSVNACPHRQRLEGASRSVKHLRFHWQSGLVARFQNSASRDLTLIVKPRRAETGEKADFTLSLPLHALVE